jgi:hypothetical protein
VLELRPTCEHCNKALPPTSTEARICSYECTFCADCVDRVLADVCPNCGGGFAPRPIRPARKLEGRPTTSAWTRPARRSGTGRGSGGAALFLRAHPRAAPRQRRGWFAAAPASKAACGLRSPMPAMCPVRASHVHGAHGVNVHPSLLWRKAARALLD